VKKHKEIVAGSFPPAPGESKWKYDGFRGCRTGELRSGTKHQVTVLENGLMFRGQRYRSLSEIARLITGSHWSGRPSSASCRADRKGSMESAKNPVRRCAIYTRKSSEEGLEQDFNSLHAQRESCEAFIKSQQGEGWRLIETAYYDGGISGGTMERPGLQQLLDDIRQGLVDVVVDYKVDRLTRSLADFAKMVEIFDCGGVSFVAVTQQFNTTTLMGRLTLNVLLSCAQFEREVTDERIRGYSNARQYKRLAAEIVPGTGAPGPPGPKKHGQRLISIIG
jgi:DNA invertase Pin-like site-specific DNA recombinase